MELDNSSITNQNSTEENYPLSNVQQSLLFLISLLIVGFGQPAWSDWFGLAASFFGYALFFRVLLCYPSRKIRFYFACAWFTCVQFIQFSWTLSHPYFYIYSVYIIFSLLIGIQFGLFGMLIFPKQFKQIRRLIALAAFWTLMEWLRLFFFSGYTWNPAGLALTVNLYSMQTASLWGVYGLTFWVLLVNLFALRVWLTGFKRTPLILWVITAFLPFVYGYIQIETHHKEIEATKTNDSKNFNAVLVQTAFPAEEAFNFPDSESLIAYILDEWKQILRITKQHAGKPIDLIVLPEYVVPFGTYSFLFHYDSVKTAFHEILGEEGLIALPQLELPLARELFTPQGSVWYVSNAFWAQAIANFFEADVLAGFEDVEDMPSGQRELYSAAIHFKPKAASQDFPANRYSKRVLVPMAEYIPFAFCRQLAATYGINGSFTSGKEATVMQGKKHPFSPSICYEETFGHIIREGKTNGAELLVNLTSDVWFPSSRLPKQHWDHSRIRTVENGLPMIRACNTGITGSCDSLGRIVLTLGDESLDSQWLSDSLYVSVPIYTFPTVYSKFGDTIIIVFSVIMSLFFLRYK